MADKPKEEILEKVSKFVSETYSAYEDLMMPRKTQLLRVYDAYNSFHQEQDEQWSTSFRINKAHEVVEKVVPSLTAKDPRWLVSVRDITAFTEMDMPEELKQREQESALGAYEAGVYGAKLKQATKQAKLLQDYLTYVFEEYGLMERVELWAKNGAVDGKGYARVGYKYETAFVADMEDVEEGDELEGEEGQEYEEKQTKKKKVMREKVVGEHPTIDVIDWTELFYDARVVFGEDRHAWIRRKEGVRAADVFKFKERFFNLDKLELLIGYSENKNKSRDQFKEAVRSMQGINTEKAGPINRDNITLTYYEGYFNASEDNDPLEEKYYEIILVDEFLPIYMKETAGCSIVEWKCFPDPKSGHAVGFVEPIVGMQEEYNYKKNMASEYINRAIRRQRIWSANSGIDPADINDPIIPTTNTGADALNNFPELPLGNINPDFFQEQNDFERQIQSATHTVDTSNPRNQQALTNTATGAKIKFFESNKVLDAVRKRFEHALERLAYKLIQCAFENIEDNIVFKKTDSDELWYANKEFLRDALSKYRIKVETNSTSATDVDSRRDEVLGFASFAGQIDAQLAASQSATRVDWLEIFKDGAVTFEKKDPEKYLTGQQQVPSAQALLGGQAGGGQAGPQIAAPEERQSNAQQLTEAVAGGLQMTP